MRFETYQVKAVQEDDEEHCTIVREDADADFFSLYGLDERGFAHCIGDFSSRQGAEAIKSAIESGR